MRSKFRLAVAAALSVVGLVLTPSLAAADVCSSCNGAEVMNRYDSSKLILIFNGSQTASIYPGQVSTRFTYWQDVDAFMLPWCPGQRIVGGLFQPKIYQPGIWYWITDQDNEFYLLRQSWC